MHRVSAEMQADLVTAGICQLPSATVGTLPTVYDEPMDGAPDPRALSTGQGAGAVAKTCTVSIATVGSSPTPSENVAGWWLEDQTVDVYVRASTPEECELTLRKIIRRYVYVQEFTMGSLHVNYAELVSSNNLGAATMIYDRIATILVRCRVAALDAA